MNNFVRTTLSTVASALLGAMWTSAVCAQTFKISDKVPVLSTATMTRDQIYYPDGAIGVVPYGSQYFIFGAGGSLGGIGPGQAAEPTGTYKFVGTLSQFRPAQVNGKIPVPSLESGTLQPSPDGSDFDRDYAGGGPTYPEVINGNKALVQIYHGEFHPDAPTGLPFYGGSGMAVSTNGGNTFKKVGQILAPNMTLQEFLASPNHIGLPIDGFMIEGDSKGNYISPNAPESQIYYYDIFSDRDAGQNLPGFAIARVKKSDLIESIASNKAPNFKKYYKPDGGFTQPGLGGSSTYIVTQGTDSLAWPQAIYSRYLGKFVLIYQTTQNKVQMRISDNLIDWSQSTPITLFDSSSDPNIKTFYPTAVGIADPTQLDQEFLVYFQQRNPSPPLNPNYYQIRVKMQK